MSMFESFPKKDDGIPVLTERVPEGGLEIQKDAWVEMQKRYDFSKAKPVALEMVRKEISLLESHGVSFSEIMDHAEKMVAGLVPKKGSAPRDAYQTGTYKTIN